MNDKKDPVEILKNNMEDYMTKVVPNDASNAQHIDAKMAFVAGMFSCINSLVLIKEDGDLKRMYEFIEEETFKIASIKRT